MKLLLQKDVWHQPMLAPGLYIYKLVADGEILATDKMLILNNASYE